MSENQAGQHSYAPGYQLDPRLYEWPQNRSPSVQSGRQHDHDQGQSQILPPISPYSTELFPREASLNNDYPSETRAYSPYEEQQYEQVFTNAEQAYSQGPSPINDSDLQLDSSTAEHESLSDQHRLHQFNDKGVADYCANLAPANGIMTPSKRGPGQLPPKSRGTPLGSRPHARRQQSERTRKTNDRLNAVNGVVVPSKLAVGELPWVVSSRASNSTTLNLSCPLCKGLFGKMDHIKSHFPACVDRNGNPDGLRWNDGLPVPKRGPKARKS